jgi:hypothetical protein
VLSLHECTLYAWFAVIAKVKYIFIYILFMQVIQKKKGGEIKAETATQFSLGRGFFY